MKEKPHISKTKAVFGFKCPACREGHLYADKSIYNPIALNGGLNTECPKCGQDLRVEPGFSYGAMYISYAFSVAYFVAATIITYLFFKPTSHYDYVIIDIAVVAILFPWTIRMSNVLNYYWMSGIKYKGKPDKK